MAHNYEVQITVKSVKGICHQEHYEGQQFSCHGKVADGMCDHAFAGMFPLILTLRHGGEFPFSPDPDAVPYFCPDLINGPVTFELRRIRQ